MQCKLLFVGERGVGKTSLRNRILYDQFETEIDPTIDVKYTKQIYIDEKPYAPVLFDFTNELSEQLMAGESDHDGYFLVFSIDSLHSFEKIRDEYCHFICRGKDSDIAPMVLIGNKCDLEGQRQVPRAMAEQLAASRDIPYIETSAKIHVNANDALTALIQEITKVKETKTGPMRKNLGGDVKAKKSSSNSNCKMS